MKTILSIFALLCFQFAFGQGSQIEILHADQGVLTKVNGQNVQKLIGNVQLKQDSTLMYCDSAFFFTSTNSIHAFHNVRMISSEAQLYCDTLYYSGTTKLGTALGMVRFNNNQIQLTTTELMFDRNQSLGTYTKRSTIFDGESVIESDRGKYFTKEDRFLFRSNVTVTNPEYTIKSDTLVYFSKSETSYFYGPTEIRNSENRILCTWGWYNANTEIAQFSKRATVYGDSSMIVGDSLYYDRKRSDSRAYGNVVVSDSTQGITVWAQVARFNEARGSGFFTGEPLAAMDMDGDSLFLKSQNFIINSDSLNRRTFSAFTGVRFYRTDLQGRCDSLAYTEIDSTIFLYRDPVVWSAKNQITGDSIRVQLANMKMDKIYISRNAFIISEDSLDYFNQIKGRNMIGHTTNGELTRVDVFGNGQTVYFGKDETNEYIGMNSAECADMRIDLEQSDVTDITFLNKPKATLYPMSQSPKELQRMDGFNWRAKERPISKDDL